MSGFDTYYETASYYTNSAFNYLAEKFDDSRGYAASKIGGEAVIKKIKRDEEKAFKDLPHKFIEELKISDATGIKVKFEKFLAFELGLSAEDVYNFETINKSRKQEIKEHLMKQGMPEKSANILASFASVIVPISIMLRTTKLMITASVGIMAQKLYNYVSSLIPKPIKNAYNAAIEKFFKPMVNKITEAGSKVKNFVKECCTTLTNSLKSVYNKFFRSGCEKIAAGIKSLFTSPKSTISAAFSKIFEGIKAICNAALTSGQNIMSSIKDAFKVMVNMVKSCLSTMKDKGVKDLGEAKAAVTEMEDTTKELAAGAKSPNENGKADAISVSTKQLEDTFVQLVEAIAETCIGLESIAKNLSNSIVASNPKLDLESTSKAITTSIQDALLTSLQKLNVSEKSSMAK